MQKTFWNSLVFFLLLTAVFPTAIFSQNKKNSATQKDTKQIIREHVQRMTTRQKIGQLCLMNFRFFTNSELEEKNFADALTMESPEKFHGLNKINPAIYKTLKDYHIGAVILFTENLSDPKEAKKFIRDMNNAALDGSNLPLLFCTDQEGGNVNRVYDFIMPSAMAIKRCGNLENAFLAGEANGRLLLDYGIHCNFAPDCDIASNPANPVIGIRSFGDDKNLVAEYSNAMHKGIKNAGVIPCAKHFPGHGDTETDSHLGLPKIKSSLSKWQKNEAVPFIKNIQNGIPMIMTAHIQMPGLDKTKIHASKTGKKITPPATLSNKILTKILRQTLGFDGVIVTDAMDMKAICDNFTPSESFILAVNAGVNLVCHPINVYSNRDLQFLEQFFAEVEAAVQNKTLNLAMLNQSVERVLLLKEQFGIIKIQGESVVPAPQKIVPMTEQEKKDAVLLSDKIQSLAARYSYKNRIKVQKNILFAVPYQHDIKWIKNYFENSSDYNYEIFCYEDATSVNAQLQEKMKKTETLILFTQLSGYGVKNPKIWSAAFPADFAKKSAEMGKAKNTIVVSTNLPYDQETFPKEQGFGFCATYNYSEKGYKAALKQIF